MELLEQRIRQDGQILPGGILKVDNFLNHQIDPQLMYEMAQEFKRLFADAGVNKVLTIEASGIAMAVMAQYLHAGDRVLLIDDFLATGAALVGLKALVEQAGGSVVGAGIAIEKAFQGGGDKLRAEGLRVESLARIASMGDDGTIAFC